MDSKAWADPLERQRLLADVLVAAVRDPGLVEEASSLEVEAHGGAPEDVARALSYWARCKALELDADAWRVTERGRDEAKRLIASGLVSGYLSAGSVPEAPDAPPGPCACCGTEMVWKAEGDQRLFACVNPDHASNFERLSVARPEIRQGWNAVNQTYEFPIILEPRAASLADAERIGARMVREGQDEVRIFDPDGRHVSTLRRSGEDVVAYRTANP
jgi:hypothetical protein